MESVLFFLILLLHFPTLRMEAATIITNANYYCDNNNGNFTAGSSFGNNRRSILSSLFTKATATGFYSESLGTGNDTVYARSFCRGDSTQQHCTACLSATSVDLIQKCPNQKKAFSYGVLDPSCTVQYSDNPFYYGNETSPMYLYYNTGNLTMNQTQFDEVWLNLTQDLALEASKGSLELKYATGERMLSNNQTIFALMQCSPDMSEILCRTCLLESINDYQGCCRGKQGGGSQKPSCNFRWDLYPFYAAPLPSPTAPPPPPTEGNNGGGNDSTRNIIIVVVVVAVVLVGLAMFILVLMKKKRERKNLKHKLAVQGEVVDEFSDEESLRFDLETAKKATDNFSDANRLGRGGFGTVYKGKLPNGKEIALKRLSTTSGQGQLEFKNEVVFLAKLQHRNLVRLLGFCTEGIEKLLIYEYVPNSSLDHFIFDSERCTLLDWEMRLMIITGIARGILYLHEDSRLQIIHRDLKASNILLDEDMNPKISDFGMAKLFSKDQGQAETSRVVGTYAYMAPEYLIQGNFSVKTDVFSFGVLVLEIVSGHRSNDSFQNGKNIETLISYTWRNWREGTLSNIIDPSLTSGSSMDIARCIHIGLLCVEQNLENRPTMASVLSMLNNHSLALQVPSQPAFVLGTYIESDSTSTSQGHSWVFADRDTIRIYPPDQVSSSEVSNSEQIV